MNSVRICFPMGSLHVRMLTNFSVFSVGVGCFVRPSSVVGKTAMNGKNLTHLNSCSFSTAVRLPFHSFLVRVIVRMSE